MKNFLLIIFITFIRASIASDVFNAVYSQDNRQFIGINSPLQLRKISKSIAMIINKDSLVNQTIKTIKLSDENGLNICPDEKFSSSYSVSACTGFLIADDLLVTAGHCISEKSECEEKIIAFDVLNKNSTEQGYPVKERNIFECKEILNTDIISDITIIRLNRKTNNRNNLKFNLKSSVEINEKVLMIGHPLGMPLMLSRVARVRDLSDDLFFRADLDSFAGNSGSPVFNQKTLEVEGILVGGQEDFFADSINNCNRYKNYPTFSGTNSGEIISKISTLSKLIDSTK